ncbi:TPA: hypothetical protein DCX66_04030 [Candidatus Nomurabacteria bacterium]|uniref:TrpR family protein YerC/YecD n=1 Tax=Candidatus Nomurabacteria bacterium GW2011_GWE1_35_16 TaxID=1618761 RepID=A0A0G0DT86_9BACT|nr:MAG: TrpR family protein YerC/YecD [Candidatus Nomurabacteria bacterium GW2011_GWF1_34_20]KKP62797.1 MAG: TrpR family protein YerC/YecD [Candidatus Nomurabacteria bacterium GW2011_GWE2_34_25]KKP66195.1 MAG: TrpR family protein YerC/YecD [Candidatus Nomurabacteria bacterium GW2011_GWE1_35_16]HAE36248.1 hypothetical protein [Candidatus Nomurabacteria bacterium]HAX65607.1 hypothetical protein [Candidatus Nomurabacteria bacterium]
MKEINWKDKKNIQLVNSFILLKTKGETEAFLRDIMTKYEITEFANRLEAARLLSKNTQYLEITNKTGLSSTTVARIAKWLKGPLGGYRIVLNKMHHTHSQNNTGKGLSLHS